MGGSSLFRTIVVGFLVWAPTQEPLSAQQFPNLPEHAPAGSGSVETCSVDGLPRAFRCGRYRVFENRDTQTGRTLDLAFVIIDAQEPQGTTGDVIIPLPGGPGQAFTGAARGFAARNAVLGRTHDLLLVDVRGVGRSHTLDCPEFEIGIKERFGTMFPEEHIRMCRDSLARRAQLDLYTTAMSVDDLEEIRRWLGYGAVNLMGTSYGTRVAQVYMRRHPEAIRTVVLNSVVPVFQPTYVHMAESLQRSLDLVVADCKGAPACRSDHPDLRLRLDSVLARLSQRPAEVEVRGERIAFGRGDFSYALRGLLYGRSDEVPSVIQRAYDGDFASLAEYYLQRAGWVGGAGGEAGYHFSALCAEDILPLTDDDVARLSAGTFMGDHLIAGYRSVCNAWDVARLPDSFWEPVESDLPVLVISGEFDPVTPPVWGEAVAAHLSNSIHVVVPGGGHGAGNECTERLIRRLLETASTDGLDPSCG